jgi:hypothetical protein
MKLDFLHRYLKNTKMSNLIKIYPLTAELFHGDIRAGGRTDGHKDRHDEANSLFLILLTRLKLE